jgi:hypothetical protein
LIFGEIDYFGYVGSFRVLTVILVIRTAIHELLKVKIEFKKGKIEKVKKN